LKAAYRLFSNEDVTYQRILAPHCERTRQRCLEPGEYLWIEDTSELDYTFHGKAKGLGRIGNDNGRGLLLHSTLAVRIDGWQLDQSPEVSVVGLVHQECWARTEPTYKRRETRRQLLRRPRESDRWARLLPQLARRPEAVRWIHISDRESDIYEAFARCQQSQRDFIIRASRARALADEDQTVFEAVAAAPVLGHYELEIRARPDSPARRATVQVRSLRVCLRGTWRPGGKLPPMEINVVEVREINAPPGQEPICWVLLTNLPVQRFVEARRIAALYAKRWLIEEYHKALKTGAKVEQSQLESRARLEALIGILAIVALRLLGSKLLARTRPEEKVDPESFGPEAIDILTARFDKPKGGWTHLSLLIAVARLGGFLARRHDGFPGWLTIWRGYQRLTIMVEGVNSLSKEFRGIEAKRCG
jgi:hypothetical protein